MPLVEQVPVPSSTTSLATNTNNPSTEPRDQVNQSRDQVAQPPDRSYCSRNFLVFTDGKNFPKAYFPTGKLRHPRKATCVVTGLPAKYKDPLTGLPYANIEAFKYIREHRKRLLQQAILKGSRKRKRAPKEPLREAPMVL